MWTNFRVTVREFTGLAQGGCSSCTQGEFYEGPPYNSTWDSIRVITKLCGTRGDFLTSMGRLFASTDNSPAVSGRLTEPSRRCQGV